MITKSLAAALLGTTLLISAAASQTSTTSTSDDKTATINSQGQWRSSKLVGVEVYNEANERLGRIEDLIISTNGNIGSIVGVGGFLGMGEHSVSVADVSLADVPQSIIDQVISQFGQLDILVNNAGRAHTEGSPARTLASHRLCFRPIGD